MSDLTDFLLARIAEDEADARHADEAEGTWHYGSLRRVLAECEAKRRTLEVATLFGCGKAVARYLASVYADHPDYRAEWRVAGE